MASAEQIDFFQEPPMRDCSPAPEEEFNLDEEIFTPGRAKIHDYKKTSTSYQKGRPAPEPQFVQQPQESPKKASIDISDERIVWAGAIFVFFGVLVFLFGYWLGGKTSRDAVTPWANNRQKQETRLAEQRAENALTMAQPPAEERPVIVPPPVVSNESSAVPQAVATIPPMVPPTAVQAITPPPIRPQTAARPTPRKTPAVKPAATPAPRVAASDGGSYTIQVSANTSMEKARAVEDSLRKAGYQSYLVEATVNGVTYYRVRAGRFGSKADAQSALSRIQGNSWGKDSFIMNLK